MTRSRSLARWPRALFIFAVTLLLATCSDESSEQAVLAHDGPREAVIDLPEAILRELSAAADTASRSYHARYTLAGGGAQALLGATVTLSMRDAGGDAVLHGAGRHAV